MVARVGFEPTSAGPKPTMMDPYTIGLGNQAISFFSLSEKLIQKSQQI